jgi:ankyrin repeat protein/L-ascorbate metabolism protein UlaG (beta-lactamase superfamily)
MKTLTKSGLVLIILLAFTIALPAQEIFDAVSKGDLVKVKELVGKNPKAVAETDNRGFTPLHYSAGTGNVPITEFLLANNAILDAKNTAGQTPLFRAIWNQMATTNLLIDKGADIFLKSNDGLSPIDIAIAAKKPIVEKMMPIVLKTSTDKKTKESVLHRLALANYKELTKKMIFNGVDIFSKNENGGTLLHSVVIGNLPDMALELLDKGLSINEKDILGRTALHYALINNDVELTRLLISKGADVNVKETAGRTPLDIAEDWNNSDLVSFLEKSGAIHKERHTYKLENNKSDKPLELTFLGNSGFLLTYGNKKILYDVPTTIDNGYFDALPLKTAKMIYGSKKPFDNINFLLVSHSHDDHIGFDDILPYIKKNSAIKMYTTLPTLDSLKKRTAGTELNNVIAVNLAKGKVTQKMDNGIEIKFYGLDHGYGLQVLGFVLKIDDLKVGFIAESDLADLKGTGIENEKIDVLMLNRGFLWDSVEVEQVKKLFNYKYLVPTHLAKVEIKNRLSEMQKSFPGLILFRDVMERKTFR